MKWTLTLGVLCLVNCAIPTVRDDQLNSQGILISINETGSELNYEDDTEALDESWQSFDNDMKQVVFKSPYSGQISNNLLDQIIKDCMKDNNYIGVLFLYNRSVCHNLPIAESVEEYVIEHMKQYLLDHFHLPSLEKIESLVISPNGQFDKALFSLLEYAGIDSSEASQNGKRSIFRLISGIPGQTLSIRGILDYYWKFEPFRGIYLDRAFERISNSLSLQEYFEFESLLDWIHTELFIMREEDWKYVKLAFQRHYKVSRVNPSYWEAWYKTRPLKYEYVDSHSYLIW